MSLELLGTVFANLSSNDAWSIQVLHISKSKRNGTSYISRSITLAPHGKLQEFLNEISVRYTQEEKGVLNSYADLREYDGSAVGTAIYKLNGKCDLIRDDFESLMKAIANPDVEVDPFEIEPQACILLGRVQIGGEQKPVKLVSMQKPFKALKNRYRMKNGAFQEIKEPILTLQPSVAAVIVESDVYMLTLAAETLFDMERSYKAVCREKIRQIEGCDIITDEDAFRLAASAGHNPRRFVSFNEAGLEKMKHAKFRQRIAKKFSIPLDGNQFDTTKDGASEKLVKILCNKGMLEPFEEEPVEVDASRKWL